jgi:hypothetical protein
MAAVNTTVAPTGTSPARDDRPGRRPALRRDGRYASVFLAPSLGGLALFTLFPTAMALGISLFDWPVFGTRSFLGLDNYSHLLHDPVFRRVVLNTVLFVVLYVPLNVVVSLGLAVWLGPQIKGRQIFRVLFFIPVMTPMVANVMVWRLLFQPGGLIDGGLQSWFGIDAPNFLGSSTWAMPAIVTMSDLAGLRLQLPGLLRRARPGAAVATGVRADRRRRAVAAVPLHHLADDHPVDVLRHHDDADHLVPGVRAAVHPDPGRSRAWPPRPSSCTSTTRAGSSSRWGWPRRPAGCCS